MKNEAFKTNNKQKCGDRKAIFLDRDGTINVDYGYVHNITEFVLTDGAIEGLKLLQDRGFLLFIITNQSGIARGIYSEKEYLSFERQIEDLLKRFGINIEKTYHCPHLYQKCNCRKPKTGLFYKAKEEYSVDFSKSFAIGDKMRDLCICEHEPVKGILIEDSGLIRNLLDAARFICMIEDNDSK